MKFAVQMYSLRGHIKTGEDMLDILGKVKALGFEGVEFAGFFGLDAETLKARLDELGLVCVGAHMGLDDFKPENLEKTLAFVKTLGAKTAGIGGADTATETALENVLAVMGGAHERALSEGVRVYFHNHTREFEAPLFATAPGTIFDRLKAVCDMQVDTYWSFYAGQENYALITGNKDRIVHLHIKDGLDGTPTALGEGNNDLAVVVKAAKDAGIEWLILENDDPVPDGLSDITRSKAWLDANAR
ncbi:MAG: sugar phosphate isomerase/epimerase [Clostridia bacterium]|nr:sugar phosphate isomerase/epimerase [Clostridia bacterium]MBR0509890.1 sugar phosphate isomerase/epimerase [Clostridia bacterium]MBR0538312.1 sugar phosphate isomerase/epimerase [Clostridia bacterium]